MRITCPTLKYWFNDIFYIKGLNSSNFLCWEREKYCKIATTTEFLHLQIYIFESDKFIYTSTCSYSLLTKVKQNHEDVDKGLSRHYIPRLWQDWLHMILDTNNLQVELPESSSAWTAAKPSSLFDWLSKSSTTSPWNTPVSNQWLHPHLTLKIYL